MYYFFAGGFLGVRVVLPVEVEGVGTIGDAFNSALLPLRVGVGSGVSTFCLAGVRFGVLFALTLSLTAVAVLLVLATMGVLPDDFLLLFVCVFVCAFVLRALFGLRFGIVRARFTGVADSSVLLELSCLALGDDFELLRLRDFFSSCDSSLYSERSTVTS